MKVLLPNGRAYDRAGTGDHSLFSQGHCCVCGKEITVSLHWLLLARSADGRFEYAINHPNEATLEEIRYGLWVAPVGAECLARNPILKPLLIPKGAE